MQSNASAQARRFPRARSGKQKSKPWSARLRPPGSTARGRASSVTSWGQRSAPPRSWALTGASPAPRPRGARPKGSAVRQAPGRLGEGRPVDRGLAGSAQATGEPFQFSPPLWPLGSCFCWWSDVKKMDLRTNSVALLSTLTPKSEESRYRKRSTFSACSCPGVDYQVSNSKSERARSSRVADTHPEVNVQ